MNATLWVCLLCLQGYLLTHALDCADGDRGCGAVEVSEVKLRPRRDSEADRERGAAHLNRAKLPGAFTAKGSPNVLMQTDRSRRHLNTYKKKQPFRRSRVSSHTLLTHDFSKPLQVRRARRNSGAAVVPHVSPIKTAKNRSRRSAARKKKTPKAILCS